MRRLPNVARLVADETAEFQLQVRFSAFYDGELDPESMAEVQWLIDNDPEAARLARDMRIGGDLWQVMLQPRSWPFLRYNRKDLEPMASWPRRLCWR